MAKPSISQIVTALGTAAVAWYILKQRKQQPQQSPAQVTPDGGSGMPYTNPISGETSDPAAPGQPAGSSTTNNSSTSTTNNYNQASVVFPNYDAYGIIKMTGMW